MIPPILCNLCLTLYFLVAMAAAEEAPLLATALEVMSRASTSSEVLSLNLTNLIILIALKVSFILLKHNKDHNLDSCVTV